jgi:hypothetical protein
MNNANIFLYNFSFSNPSKIFSLFKIVNKNIGTIKNAKRVSIKTIIEVNG